MRGKEKSDSFIYNLPSGNAALFPARAPARLPAKILLAGRITPDADPRHRFVGPVAGSDEGSG
jgi:hypothetical protein